MLALTPGNCGWEGASHLCSHGSVAPAGALHIRQAQRAREWRSVRAFFEAYGAELGVDLSFQGFAAELDDVAAAYPAPGGVWLASRARREVGCVGLRSLGDGYAELKRLYAVPGARGDGVGRALVETALAAARATRFLGVRLDTLRDMDAAQTLYASLGFLPIAPYRANPLPGTRFLELAFSTAPGG